MTIFEAIKILNEIPTKGDEVAAIEVALAVMGHVARLENRRMDCNPDHFGSNRKFSEFMDDPAVASFGRWMYANGFNMGITAAGAWVSNISEGGADG